MSLLTISPDAEDIRLESERLIIRTGDGQPFDIPLCEITHVAVCGRPRVTLHALYALLDRQCRIDFFSAGGRWLGGMGGNGERRAERLRRQVRMTEDPEVCLTVARLLAAAKLYNQRRVLSRLAAKRGQLAEFRPKLRRLRDLMRKIDRAENIESLRGEEGIAGAEYFRMLNCFLPEAFRFEVRSRRPPRDPANALLSFGYSVTAARLDGMLKKHGLESLWGFLHRPSDGGSALAWDLLEVFRAPFCDMLNLHLLNHRRLRQEHFVRCEEDGGVRLTDVGRRIFFRAFEEKLNSNFHVRNASVRTNYMQQFEQQVLLVLEILQGRTDVDFYRMP